MSVPAEQLILSVRQYLELEETSELRHEYVAGQIYEMVGGTLGHNLIACNVRDGLARQLQGTSCHAYILDVKVKIKEANSFYYPDVVVSCEPYKAKGVYIESPSIIFEVLSPSTEPIDRREKRLAYGQLPSLKEYVLISQGERRIEVYSKESPGQWSGVIVEGDELKLTAIPGRELYLSIEQIYVGV